MKYVSKHTHSSQSRRTADLLLSENQEFVIQRLDAYLQNSSNLESITKLSGVVFICLDAGAMTIQVGAEHHQAVAGNLVVVQPQKPFTIVDFDSEVSGYILELKGDGVLGTMGDHSLIFQLDFLNKSSNSLFELTHTPTEYFINIFRRIEWEQGGNKENLSIVNAYVITLLLELNVVHNEMIQSNRAAIELSRKLKLEVYNTLATPLKTSDYASRLSVSPNHLNKSIKSALGISASQLIDKIRLTEAKYLLMRSDYTISEVGESVGFVDSSHFSRFFKKYESMSPSAFRKMIDLSH